jgi:hypothetical protein
MSIVVLFNRQTKQSTEGHTYPYEDSTTDHSKNTNTYFS